MRRWRTEMIRGGPRIALEKVKRRGLYCLLPIRIVVLFQFYSIVIFIFCDLNI